MAPFNPGTIVVVVAMVATCLAFLIAAARRQWLHWERCSPSRLALSNTGRHRLLAVYRIFLAMYCLSTWLWVLIDSGAGAFLFYTFWSFTVVMVYFILAAQKSISGWRTGFEDVSYEPSRGWYDRSVFLLFELAWTVVFLVDVVLWSVLYPHTRQQADYDKTHPTDDPVTCCHQFINYGSLVMHGANFFFMLGEVLLNNMSTVPSHIGFVVLFPIIFGAYSWIMKGAGYAYVYFFLDPTKPLAPLWYLGMSVGHVLFYFLGYAVIRLRDRLRGHNASAEQELAESQYLLSTNTIMA